MTGKPSHHHEATIARPTPTSNARGVRIKTGMIEGDCWLSLPQRPRQTGDRQVVPPAPGNLRHERTLRASPPLGGPAAIRAQSSAEFRQLASGSPEPWIRPLVDPHGAITRAVLVSLVERRAVELWRAHRYGRRRR